MDDRPSAAAGFDGQESGIFDGLAWYERACTAEEAELLDAHEAAAIADEQAELTAYAEAQRDRWFAKLRTELAEMNARSAGLSSASGPPPDAPRGLGAG